VARDLHLREHRSDLSLGIHYERGALDTHILAPIHALFLPHAIGFGNLMIGIRDEGIGKAILFCKLCLGLRLVRRKAHDLGIFLGELLYRIAEFAGFLGASRRIGLGEKEQNYRLALQFRELERTRLDFRSAIACLETHMRRL